MKYNNKFKKSTDQVSIVLSNNKKKTVKDFFEAAIWYIQNTYVLHCRQSN